MSSTASHSFQCIFCRGNGPFNTREHIIPESLGNDEDILLNAVCDKCQNYISLNIEKPALDKTPFAFWRTLLGIRTKRGKLPSVDTKPKSGGKIPAYHPLGDAIIFTAHDDGSTSVDINDTDILHEILLGEKEQFNIVLSPWHLNVMGRFLGKMGLEFVALTDNNFALSPHFDELRHYVRESSSSYLWPIYWGQYKELKDLERPVIDKGDSQEQEVECYRYTLGETVRGERVFAFAMGVEIGVICLSHKIPDSWFCNIIENASLNCLYYPDKSW